MSVFQESPIPKTGFTVYVMIWPSFIFSSFGEVIFKRSSAGVIFNKFLASEKKSHAVSILTGICCIRVNSYILLIHAKITHKLTNSQTHKPTNPQTTNHYFVNLQHARLPAAASAKIYRGL